MKHYISNITGVNSVVHPMCRNSCLAFSQGHLQTWITARKIMNLNCVQSLKSPSKNSTLCGIMHQLQRSSIIGDGKLGRSFASFWETLAISSPTMTFTVVATILKMSEVKIFKITILFLCSQSIMPSSMHTRHLTAGYIYELSWTSHPKNNIWDSMLFLVALSLVNQRTSTLFYSRVASSPCTSEWGSIYIWDAF